MKTVVTTKNQNADSNKSKIYTKYEKLLSEIENQRRFIDNLDEGLQKASAKINGELSMLEKDRHLLLRAYLIRLDILAVEIGLGKYNREWFEGYMADELQELLEYFGFQDKEISGLYQKYAKTTIDEMANEKEAIEMAKSMSELFGFEVDFKEILEKGEMAFFEEYRQQIEEHLKNHTDSAKEQFWEETGEDQTNQKKQNTQVPPKSAQATDEAAVLAKDARNIYMRLIKKFHPDLETDHALKDQKTEIVKQVTKAYQENDFFSLLKLQITYLDENENDAATIADDLLKRYNKILQRQLNELKRQVSEMRFGSGAIIADFIDKNGKFSAQKFAARRRAIEKEANILKTVIADSKKRPKGWFKDQIAMIKEMAQQNMMQDIFADIFTGMKF
jgi:hypothetical protein